MEGLNIALISLPVAIVALRCRPVWAHYAALCLGLLLSAGVILGLTFAWSRGWLIDLGSVVMPGIDAALHDTYYVVAGAVPLILVTVLPALVAALGYGAARRRRIGTALDAAVFWLAYLSIIGWLVMSYVQARSMPRRYVDFESTFAMWQITGTAIILVGTACFLIAAVRFIVAIFRLTI